MKRTVFRWLAVTSLVFAIVLPVLARTRPRYGGTLRVQTRAEASELARELALETLTRVDDAGRAQPLLAARWLSQNDGMRWQFWLRPGLNFHDGTPVTPAAVVQALTAAKCEGACPWRSVRVLGDSVLFEADQPVPEMPAILALDRYAIDRNATGMLIGTGPFHVTSLGSDSATLAAFEEAWLGRPFVDAVEIRGGRSVRDQLLDLGVGRADVVEVPAEQLRRAQQERMQVLASRPMEMIAVRVEPGSAVLQDQRTRAALAMTFDRTAIYNVIFQKQGEISASVLPAVTSGYAFLFSPAADVPRARELRAESPRVGPITLAVDPGDSTLQLVAERLALNAREAGFQVQVVPDNANHTADMTLQRMELKSSNAAVVLRRFGAAPKSTAQSVDTGYPAESLYQSERELLERYTIIPLLHVPRGFALRSTVRGLELTPAGEPKLAGAWLEPTR